MRHENSQAARPEGGPAEPRTAEQGLRAARSVPTGEGAGPSLFPQKPRTHPRGGAGCRAHRRGAAPAWRPRENVGRVPKHSLTGHAACAGPAQPFARINSSVCRPTTAGRDDHSCPLGRGGQCCAERWRGLPTVAWLGADCPSVHAPHHYTPPRAKAQRPTTKPPYQAAPGAGPTPSPATPGPTRGLLLSHRPLAMCQALYLAAQTSHPVPR